MAREGRPILCVDFDGVIHSYSSGWQGVETISDPVVPGFFDWLTEVNADFQVQVYSSRSKVPKAILAMMKWIEQQHNTHVLGGGKPAPIDSLTFAHEKPAAYLTIDDRAITFKGTFPSVASMKAFKPWHKK